MSAADNKFAEQQAKAVAQIANVSKLLRDSIAAALPVAPEQYLSIGIPGTTIDTRHVREGGTFVWDSSDTAFIPMQVQQEESKLVDNVVPLSYIMLGNTGKSVARSYARTLDKLVARKATVKTGEGERRSPGNSAYDKAMTYLTMPNPLTGKTPVEDYVTKQSEWASAQDRWDLARQNAKAEAIAAYPSDIMKQTEHYNEWNQSHYRKYKFAVQGRYMDWVSNGHKFDVEHNFGTIDVDSVMARIESSKESLRNSTIVDADGSNEVFLVNLTPKNWATLCKQKADGWFQRNGEYTLDQIDGEIERLDRLRISYEAMAAAMGIDITKWESIEGAVVKYPVSELAEPGLSESNSKLKTAFGDIYEKEAAVASEQAKLRDMTPEEQEKEKAKEDSPITKAIGELKQKRTDLAAAIEDNRQKHSDWTKWASASMNDGKSKNEMIAWLRGVVSDLDNNVVALKAKRDIKAKSAGPPVTVIQGAASSDSDGKGTDTAPDGAEQPDPVFGVGKLAASLPAAAAAGDGGDGGSKPAPGTGSNTGSLPVAGTISDPWVTINASFSASDQSSTEDTSSWGFSVGGGAGWGLWSVGGSYSHDQSSSDFSSDMASCDVSVTFSALVVNIGRPWLYGEIFGDDDLDVPTNVRVSPGPRVLHELMKSQKDKTDKNPLGYNQGVVNELAAYSSFPAYPTSFVVAADTTIEFHGNTSHVEKHFSAQSNAGSASVGWGPFSVSSSFHQSSSHQSFQCQSTATGCRLTFGAPQIIGWVSQILPELPRTSGYVSMVQNVVK